jgi:hypothetical protein
MTMVAHPDRDGQQGKLLETLLKKQDRATAGIGSE